MMMTSADFYYASKGAQRIRGMNTTAPTFSMLKRLYSEDAQTRIENRRSNSISMRIASWLLNELVECVELRDSLEEDGRARSDEIRRVGRQRAHERAASPQSQKRDERAGAVFRRPVALGLRLVAKLEGVGMCCAINVR